MSYDRRIAVRKALLLSLLASLLCLAGCFKRGPEVIQPSLSVVVASSTSALNPGQSVTINALVYDQNKQGVQWSVSPLNFGTLSNPTFDPSTLTATVNYIAPSVIPKPTKVIITATSITNPNISGSLTFPITPITISLVVESPLGLAGPPAPQTVNPNDQLIVSAVVNSDLSRLGATFSISPSGVGSLTTGFPANSNVTYNAPPTISEST